MSFRQAMLEDFTSTEAPELIRSSYKHIAYPLGCSRSELAEVLGDGDFVLQTDAGTVAGFLRIKALFAGICYFDLHLLQNDCAALLEPWLIEMGDLYGVGKYYVQVLSYEQRERQCLEALGFAHEATLRQHVFIEGQYHDLIMMGSEDYRV